MQLKFALNLAAHRYHTCIMRAQADLAKPHVVSLVKQLHAEDPQAAEIVSNRFGYSTCAMQCQRRHFLRLPAFHIIPVNLDMTDGFAKISFYLSTRTYCTHGKLCYFVIKLNESLDNHSSLIHSATACSVIPRGFQFFRPINL